MVAAAVLSAGVAPGRAAAQEARDTSIESLPRPGYEPRTVRIGTVVLRPSAELTTRFDDNIRAAATARESDVVFAFAPRLEARRVARDSDIRVASYANLIRYAENERENVTEFGVLVEARGIVDSRNTVTVKGGFDRTFERRGEPEANLALLRGPALIDVTNAEVQYRLSGGRIAAVVSGGISRLDYLAVEDADRDLLTYTASMRGSVQASNNLSVFVQPYFNRREPRIPIDRGGIDRRNNTFGALAGFALSLASRVDGEIGVGAFRSDPADPSLPSFTGFAASGRLTWHPRVRTAISFDLFGGDVATVRIGAIGRIDTRYSISIDQEVRHNLLLRAVAGIRNIRFVGNFDERQNYKRAELSARYLFNRHLSVEAVVNYLQRDTPVSQDNFKRWQQSLALRFTY